MVNSMVQLAPAGNDGTAGHCQLAQAPDPKFGVSSRVFLESGLSAGQTLRAFI